MKAVQTRGLLRTNMGKTGFGTWTTCYFQLLALDFCQAPVFIAVIVQRVQDIRRLL